MSKLKIHENGSNFTLNGQDFFYLADTVWSAFTNSSMEEWEFYLEKRYQQGYSVLQVNTLPQWDRSMSDCDIYPFASLDGQKFDFTQWNEAYYSRACKMCQMAVDKGFQLALVVLWLNYVPGTWGSRMSNINIMPKDFVAEYVSKVVDVFEEFDPIYVISGDTDFDTKESVEYYEIALDTVCKKSKDSLKAMHIKRGYDYIPKQYLDRISFYMFQSGHNAEGQEMAYVLPENFSKKYPKKPIINAEPCYEQMGYSRNLYGRFQAYDIRKAAWSSILSGACAGVTYGAHGVWNWKKLYKKSKSLFGEGFDEAFPMQEALLFPGAWDYGYIRSLFEMNHITELIPAQELITEKSQEIRMARTPDYRYIIYMPYTTEMVLKIEPDEYKIKVIDLETGRIARGHYEVKENGIRILMHSFQKDAVIFLTK
ncbi:MAG: DUF4038 domain-containing protein [Lachnotalea sp.]